VELSIVLVIVALIVAGVIQGQQMIENAKLARVIKEVNEIKAAFNNFRLKYNTTPGDMNNAADLWAGVTSGNGNGVVDKEVTTIGESLEVWRHLTYAEVLPGNYTGALSASLLVPETNVPNSKYAKFAGYTYYNRASGTTYSVYTKVGNVLEFGGCNNSQTNFIYCSGGVMTGEKASGIDKKMDDGDASTGLVMGADGYSAAATRTLGCASADYSAASATYTLNSTAPACRLFFWLEEPEN
jgi:hypothetical protein